MPKAIEEGLRIYGPDFARIHGIYSQHGYVYSEPKCLGFARPCVSTRYQDWVELDEADAWWIELAIGEGALPHLFRCLPVRLPYIGFRRDFKGSPTPRFYPSARLDHLLKWAPQK